MKLVRVLGLGFIFAALICAALTPPVAFGILHAYISRPALLHIFSPLSAVAPQGVAARVMLSVGVGLMLAEIVCSIVGAFFSVLGFRAGYSTMVTGPNRFKTVVLKPSENSARASV